MVRTPKRPPGRPRSERRKPKGPSTVALRPDDQTRHDHLVAVAELAREQGHPDWAGAVDYVLSPLGPDFLARIQPATVTSSLALRMTETRRDAIVDAAKKEAAESDPDGRVSHTDVIGGVVEAGFADWLAGTFDLVLEGGKVGKGNPAARKSVLTCQRLNTNLLTQVVQRCRDMKESGEFAPGRAVHVSTVAAYALYRHFKVGPYAPDADTGTAG